MWISSFTAVPAVLRPPFKGKGNHDIHAESVRRVCVFRSRTRPSRTRTRPSRTRQHRMSLHAWNTQPRLRDSALVKLGSERSCFIGFVSFVIYVFKEKAENLSSVKPNRTDRKNSGSCGECLFETVEYAHRFSLEVKKRRRGTALRPCHADAGPASQQVTCARN